jgi:hypothetical protein
MIAHWIDIFYIAGHTTLLLMAYDAYYRDKGNRNV